MFFACMLTLVDPFQIHESLLIGWVESRGNMIGISIWYDFKRLIANGSTSVLRGNRLVMSNNFVKRTFLMDLLNSFLG